MSCIDMNVNFFPNEKFFSVTDTILKVAQTEEVFFERAENIVGKGRKLGLLAFYPVPMMFAFLKTLFQAPLIPSNFYFSHSVF